MKCSLPAGQHNDLNKKNRNTWTKDLNYLFFLNKWFQSMKQFEYKIATTPTVWYKKY